MGALVESKDGRAPGFEIGLAIEAPEDFDQRRHETGPSCLVTGANAGAVVAVEYS